MVLEGGKDLATGSILDLPPHRISEMLDARELLVVKYSDLVVDTIMGAAKEDRIRGKIEEILG